MRVAVIEGNRGLKMANTGEDRELKTESMRNRPKSFGNRRNLRQKRNANTCDIFVRVEHDKKRGGPDIVTRRRSETRRFVGRFRSATSSVSTTAGVVSPFVPGHQGCHRDSMNRN